MSDEPRFSARTCWDLRETPLVRALHCRREAGLPLLDLTASNPTRCGFHYDEASILSPLAAPGALIYDPDPRGMFSARQAVAAYYRDRAAQVDSRHIFLTTGTSEAYSWLFRLLCDPGDEVLIGQPGYPLFDFLAHIEDVRLQPYPLFYDHGWQIDLEELSRRITPRTRAIAVVHPNNPTGHFTQERGALERLCSEFGLALIVDEVFLDYPLPSGQHDPAARSFSTGEHPALTFVLSGISKVAALPQMKAAWIAAFGPEERLGEALERLEVLADTFLSMNAPVQCALPSWLAGSPQIQQQISARTVRNLASLDAALAVAPAVTRLRADAGWYAILRVPALAPDEQLAVRLIEEHGVSVHPGYFFGMEGDGWLVVSLLTRPDQFEPGIRAVTGLFR